MDCLMCGTACGTREVPMHYLYIARPRANPQPFDLPETRHDIEGFCSKTCALAYVQAHPTETADVPRCVVCGEIIVCAPWYISFSSDQPRHYECTPGAADE